MSPGPRTVVVHERFTELGGSETVAAELAGLLGAVRIHAPLIDRAVVPAGIDPSVLSDSWLRWLYRGGPRYEHLLAFLPRAMASMDVRDADLVVVSHHAFAHRIRPPASVPVVSYTHTPARWMWDDTKLDAEEGSPLKLELLRRFARRQRELDRSAAQRPDVIVVNSTAVADRVRRWWDRDSVVVPPPVDTVWYTPDWSVRREDFFLWAGRLVPYKRPDVAVLAARASGVRLLVAGDGRARPETERLAGPDTTFLGRVSEGELRDLYRRCRALIFPGEEDFGIVPVEAMACGAPVLALDAGGARDTVLEGPGGRLVRPADGSRDAAVEAFAEAMTSLDDGVLEPRLIRLHAERFDTAAFRGAMRAVVDGALSRSPVADISGRPPAHRPARRAG